jgi:hypothetical protein
MEVLYLIDARAGFVSGGAWVTRNFIATHGLGLPEFLRGGA